VFRHHSTPHQDQQMRCQRREEFVMELRIRWLEEHGTAIETFENSEHRFGGSGNNTGRNEEEKKVHKSQLVPVAQQ